MKLLLFSYQRSPPSVAQFARGSFAKSKWSQLSRQQTKMQQWGSNLLSLLLSFLESPLGPVHGTFKLAMLSKAFQSLLLQYYHRNDKSYFTAV